jgi:outer membrane protein insertion porin family/translocation and assembly module TamA
MTPPRTIIIFFFFAAAVAAGATILARPAAAQVTTVVGPEVRQVVFEGNATFPNDSLERAIVTSETRCRHWLLNLAPPWFCPLGFDFALRRSELREVEVERDAARLRIWYQQRGFREAAVTAEALIEADETAEVRFRITEGRPVIADSIAYVGAEDVAVPNLLNDLPIRSGDRWSTLYLDATRDTLTRRLTSRGYPYADVLRQTVFPVGEPYHAHVTFEIEPGTYARYGEIQVAGIEHLSESTILRTLPFRSGDPYRVDQLVDAQNRLFGLEMVTSASITPDLQSEPDSVVPLLVQVQEGDPYRVRSGVGWNRSECLNAESVWTSRNFLGGGRVLQVRGRLANIMSPTWHDNWGCRQVGDEEEYTELTWLTALDFSQPWIFSTRNSFNASLFAERQSVPEVFIRHAVGLQLALVRAVGPRTPLTLSYRPELSRLEAAEALLCTGFLVCTEEDIGVLTSSQRLAPVGLNLTRDLSNSLLNPTSGYRLIVDLEHASGWTGSEFRYDRAVAEGTWYSSLVGSAVLATRIRGGWVGSDGDVGAPSEIIPPQKRFYAGGANSVRGFAQSRLGPRVRVVTQPGDLLAKADPQQPHSTEVEVASHTSDATGAPIESRPTGGTRVRGGNPEIRFGVSSDLEAVTFVDFGQVWGADQGIRLGALELTPGIGLRYLSPVGPLRLDVGYNFRGDERLAVITRRIEPNGTGGYTTTDDLAVLEPRVLFDGSESRFQLHISIGQAF